MSMRTGSTTIKNSETIINLGGKPGGNNTDVQFNDNGVFGGEDNFTYIKGASPKVRVKKDVPIIFDSDAGADTKIVYNSSNSYLEITLDGVLRAQF